MKDDLYKKCSMCKDFYSIKKGISLHSLYCDDCWKLRVRKFYGPSSNLYDIEFSDKPHEIEKMIYASHSGGKNFSFLSNRKNLIHLSNEDAISLAQFIYLTLQALDDGNK